MAVLAVQVDEALGTREDVDAQLLLQVETDMLLGLVVHQLTASIPDSYPGALGVRQWAFCHLNCSSLLKVFERTKSGLHQLPLSAAYTGPQLTLQVMPSPLGPPAAVLHGQQQQQQQRQQPQWNTVTPAAQLLTELLPLLTSYCLARLQQRRPAAPAPQQLPLARHPPWYTKPPPLGALRVTCTKGLHQGLSTRLCSNVKGGGFTTKGLVDLYQGIVGHHQGLMCTILLLC
jgi:hypothetical protein